MSGKHRAPEPPTRLRLSLRWRELLEQARAAADSAAARWFQ